MLSFDIETTGLDPHTDTVRAISYASEEGWSHSAGILWGDEHDILISFSRLLRKLDPIELVTWNGDEFDLPFLAVRYAGNSQGPVIRPTGEQGKYGNPLYRGSWHGKKVRDIAPEWKQYAEQNQCKWSLKPVAQSVGLVPVTVAQEVLLGEDIYPILPYGVSDAIVTLRLAQMARDGL